MVGSFRHDLPGSRKGTARTPLFGRISMRIMLVGVLAVVSTSANATPPDVACGVKDRHARLVVSLDTTYAGVLFGRINFGELEFAETDGKLRKYVFESKDIYSEWLGDRHINLLLRKDAEPLEKPELFVKIKTMLKPGSALPYENGDIRSEGTYQVAYTPKGGPSIVLNGRIKCSRD